MTILDTLIKYMKWNTINRNACNITMLMPLFVSDI